MIKPTILIILIVCVAGYIFCSRWLRSFTSFSRTEGYHTFLYSAAAGLGLLLVNFFFFVIATPFLQDMYIWLGWDSSVMLELKTLLKNVLLDADLKHYEVLMMTLALSTLLTAFILPPLWLWLSRWATKQSASRIKVRAFAKHATSETTPEFTHVCWSSMQYGLPVAFTLSNNKVYIGFPVPIENHVNDIQVIPLVSGYRDEDTLSLILTTDYVETAIHLMKEIPEEEHKLLQHKFLITIPVREIVHANLHDTNYREYFDKSKIENAENKFKKAS